MDTGIIKKENIKGIIESLIHMGKVVAPTRQDDLTLFSVLSSSESLDLDYTNSTLSPKNYFFPQTEVLFCYKKEQNQIYPPLIEDKPAYLVGVRPCDVKAITLLDCIFDDPQYKDVYYLKKRRNTAVIGLACTKPQSTCFCTSVGGGPFDTSGMDMLWQDLGDRYLIRILTPQGEELALKLPGIDKAEEKDISEAEEQSEKILSMIPPAFEAEKISQNLGSSFEASVWEPIHEKCLGCAACTFVCPTCHCFDIQDENSRDLGRRVKLWDSCMFPLFTLHTSGHNPRLSGKERIRQRIMHKFNYFKVNNGHIACVGCGRCIRECPVNMDIRQIVSAFS